MNANFVLFITSSLATCSNMIKLRIIFMFILSKLNKSGKRFLWFLLCHISGAHDYAYVKMPWYSTGAIRGTAMNIALFSLLFYITVWDVLTCSLKPSLVSDTENYTWRGKNMRYMKYIYLFRKRLHW